jgi:hypothetical protein
MSFVRVVVLLFCFEHAVLVVESCLSTGIGGKVLSSLTLVHEGFGCCTLF